MMSSRWPVDALLGGKGFIERAEMVRVEIVADQVTLRAWGKVLIEQSLNLAGPVDPSAARRWR